MTRNPTPLGTLVGWMVEPVVRVNLLLLALCTLSALAVSYHAHRMRLAYVEQQGVEAQRDELLDERGRLLLERSAFSSFSRVESVASEELHMRVPAAADTQLVLP